MKTTKFAALTLGAFLLSGSGCGLSPSTGMTTAAISGSKALAADPATKEEFIKAVATRGVKLTDVQIETIRISRTIKPNGEFAPRPAENLTAQQNLDVHFRKHGNEFSPKLPSADAYKAQAIELAEGKRGTIKFLFDITSFKKGYQSCIVRWNPSTTELTALRPDGALTTYYHDDRMDSKRFVVVPIF